MGAGRAQVVTGRGSVLSRALLVFVIHLTGCQADDAPQPASPGPVTPSRGCQGRNYCTVEAAL
jgi:hypothetical protein